MDNSNEKFEEQLENEPISKEKGFSEQLRMRISEQLDKQAKKQRRRKKLIHIAVACLCVLLFSSIHITAKHHPETITALPEVSKSTTLSVMSDQHSEDAKQQSVHIASSNNDDAGLLLGLRTDQGSASEYRTLYIVANEENASIHATGPGIILPYKQKFIRLQESVTVKNDQIHSRFIAIDADQVEDFPLLQATNDDVIDARGNFEERLIYVSNEYISIEQTGSYDTDAWVTKVPFLQPVQSTEKQKTINSERKKVIIGEIFPNLSTEKQQAIQYDWSIRRTAGSWIAVSNEDNQHAIDHPLPNLVVSHDRLCCEWETIQTRFPHAVDALFSPANDVLVIIEDEQIGVYNGSEQLRLKLPIDEQETIIMAQWATGRYVQEWSEKTKKYLKSPNE